MEPYQLTLAEAARNIEAKELSPVELTASVLSRIDAVEDKITAFATVTAELAAKAAAAAESEIAAGGYRGPLHGIPVGIKDLYETAGVETTSSSKVRADHVPEQDSAVVEKLLAAGSVMVGKTHTHEFAYGAVTPTTRNPWDLDRMPGGSSGGSGAAVAAGECFVGMGSDTGGSIRIPASVCGTVGLKPTYGRVSRRGVASLSWSLDHVGPLTRTVADAALVMNAITGYDRSDPASVDVPVPDFTTGPEVDGLTIGVPANYYTERVDPEVAAAVSAAIAVLVERGMRVREVEIPLTPYILPTEWGIMLPEASAYHQKMLRDKADLYTDDVRLYLEVGEFVLATDYLKALRARTVLQQAWREMFVDIDVLIAPTLTTPALRVDDPSVTWPDGSTEAATDTYVRFSAPANVTGLPSLSVPCGFTGAGLPIGMQIMGKPFTEPVLLAVGQAYESATDWAKLAPLP
ncbi:amidase [Amycolatopsis alkalitolerans]|uniref:Asp-tRNA(Asn)/Glu-tRNA(Gln) amidotransferase subunit GatA n=1 Tax=Amycolatopsis alkalitolerans TaxID=2547244 RepID=A0A5C4M0S1_9PSEU|nr:amidase [Amycolatopsis alkalitolerans]TNC24424.1 Asp-tRNA(Asn)/Glu-tRNA(Gln) amidotransferase subunit GatA [Amycolatopsis alkalitolerans]